MRRNPLRTIITNTSKEQRGNNHEFEYKRNTNNSALKLNFILLTKKKNLNVILLFMTVSGTKYQLQIPADNYAILEDLTQIRISWGKRTLRETSINALLAEAELDSQ